MKGEASAAVVVMVQRQDQDVVECLVGTLAAVAYRVVASQGLHQEERQVDAVVVAVG